MDVQHLPLEHPATYKQVRQLLVEALVPALKAALAPQWETLPPNHSSSTARRDALAVLLMQHREELQREFFVQLNPVHGLAGGVQKNILEFDKRRHTQQRDATDTNWELVVWSLHALLQQTYEGKRVCSVVSDDRIVMRDASIWPQRRAHATPVWMVGSGASAVALTAVAEDARVVPFFLDQLARKLAGVKKCDDEWKDAHVARCIQVVFYELSAEHTLERLQWYYGKGGDFSLNRITQVLRPVDTHQNRALGVLVNPKGLEAAAKKILGTDVIHETFQVRQVRDHKKPMPVPWLMNWTDEFQAIQDILAKALTQFAHQPRPSSSGDDADTLAPLSNNKDVYIRKKKRDKQGEEDGKGELNLQATQDKIEGALKQLFDLHHLGRAASGSVDIGELLERLGQDDMQHSEGQGKNPADPAQEPEDSADAASHPLADLFNCLDGEPELLVRVAVLVRLCARLPDKAARLKLQDDLKQHWDKQEVFGRLGLKEPRYDKLTEKSLALACGLLPKAFEQRVMEGVQRFDLMAALAGEGAEHASGALSQVTPPILRVGVALRLLQRLPQGKEREQHAQALLETWSDPSRFDGGLFGYLGVEVSCPKPPQNGTGPRAAEALLNVLTDEVLAWGMDIDAQSFRKEVDVALARFDSDHPINPRSHSRSKAGTAKTGAKQ